MTTFTIHTEDKAHLNAVKAVLKALNVKFEISKDDKPYNPEFVAKIIKSKKEIATGKTTRINIDKLDEFLGI
ncbi:MAG: hypothetical protein KA734_10935 [Fluviicola sp.]|nr:hypothetical protein [Fluviicola sp.]MBP6271824.1 hypothetical protein [Fluviicola sp.]